MNTHPNSEALEAALKHWQYFAPTVGANVALVEPSSGNWYGASGLASIYPEVTLKVEQPSYIYSITKSFAAVIIMQLVEEGCIQLDQAASNYLPEKSLPDTFTVRQLLNHTSGIPNYTELDNYGEDCRDAPGDPWSFDYVLNATFEKEADFLPGEGWHYSNTGYMLLLLIIESITQSSFQQAVAQRIVNKLKLQQTRVAETPAEPGLTQGFSPDLSPDARMENITGKYSPWWCKTGLIISTAGEVGEFYRALFQGELVSHHSLKAMQEFVSVGEVGVHPFFKKPGYGLGLMIDPNNQHGVLYGHGGDGPGFNTFACWLPDFNGRELGLSVICNTTIGGHPFRLINQLLSCLK